MKVVILCGGQGTRLREETEYKPKPMVTIGGKPILWHIMKSYAAYGFRDFVLCLGYKGDVIRDYFLKHDLMNTDFTIDLATKDIQRHSCADPVDWRVTLAETGPGSMTGGRVKRIERYVDDDFFMLTYGDGVADVDIRRLLKFHQESGRIATVTAVRPIARFGELSISDGLVQDFREKPQVQDGWINGGFFVFGREVFDYLGDDDCVLEKEPLEKLARDRQLAVYQHDGYWQCMDTYRDVLALEEEWRGARPRWKVWE